MGVVLGLFAGLLLSAVYLGAAYVLTVATQMPATADTVVWVIAGILSFVQVVVGLAAGYNADAA